MQIDNKDIMIINELTINARESASNIADSIGMSVPAVAERIKKLQDAGIIEGFSINLNYNKIGMDVSAFITIISESSKFFEEVVNRANKNFSVLNCYTTTGPGSHILYVKTQDTESLEKLLREVQSWPGIKRTETQLVLSSYSNINSLKLSKKEKEDVKS